MNSSNHTDHAAKQSSLLSLSTYLTVQLQEIICMGPGHALTWADNRAHLPLRDFANLKNRHNWLQVSVQGGAKCYLMVQFVLPCEQSEQADCWKQRMDHHFAQYGWINEQADGRECLVYYVAQSPDPRYLLDEAEFAARQCAEVMRRLWNAHSLEEIALLGARGPKLRKQQVEVSRPQPAEIHGMRRAA